MNKTNYIQIYRSEELFGLESAIQINQLLVEHGCIIHDRPADYRVLVDLERLYGIKLEHLRDSQGRSVLIQVHPSGIYP